MVFKTLWFLTYTVFLINSINFYIPQPKHTYEYMVDKNVLYLGVILKMNNEYVLIVFFSEKWAFKNYPIAFLTT